MSRKFRLMMILAFGTLSAAAHADGIVILDGGVGEPDNLTNAPRVAADGRIFLQVSSNAPDCTRRVIATDAFGTLLPTFGQTGTLMVPGAGGTAGCITDLIPTSATTIQTLDGFVEQRDNAFVPMWTSPDIYAGQAHASVGGGSNTVFVQQPDGKWVVGGRFIENGMAESSSEWTLARLTSTGQMDATFAAGSVLRQQFAAISGINTGIRAYMLSIHALPNGQLLASGRVERARNSNDFDTNLSRYNTNGTLDFSFGANGELRLPDSLGVSVRDPSGRVYLVGAHGHVTRLAADYSVDGTYAGGNTDSNLTITDIAVDSAGRAVIFGTHPGGVGHVYIARFDTSGNPDVTLNGTGVVDYVPPRIITTCRGALHSGDLPLVACTMYGEADPGGIPSVDVMLARFTATGLLDVSFGATQPDTDAYPDAISFADVTAPFGGANVQSAPITVTGTNVVSTVTLSAPGGSYGVSFGCNGVWTFSGQVSPGQTLCVRLDAATTAGQSRVLTVYIGGRVATFTVNASGVPADLVPDAFAFPSQNDVARSATISSTAITVQGISGNSPLAVVNGSFSIDCSGNFGTSPTTITNGQTVCVRHTSPNTFGTATTTTLTIGGVQGTFTSTTLAADTTPDAFSFTDQVGVTPGAVVTSNAIVIAGLGADAPISIVGGEYSLGCVGVFTATAGTLAPGQSVCVHHTAAATNSTMTHTTLTIGTVSDEFTSTTLAAQSSHSSSGGGGGGSLDLVFLLALMSGLVLRWSYSSKRSEADQHATEHEHG